MKSIMSTLIYTSKMPDIIKTPVKGRITVQNAPKKIYLNKNECVGMNTGDLYQKFCKRVEKELSPQ